MIERHFTIGQLAAYLDVDADEIREATERGDLMPVRIGRSVRYPESQGVAWSRNPTARRMTKIYFIREGDDGPIKIGRGRDPELRLEAHQCGNPRELKLLGSIPGLVTDEREIHRRFAALRGRGEWFEATPDLLAFIAQTLSPMDTERTSVGR